MKKRLAMLFALCLMTGVLSSCGKDTGSTETTKKDDNTLVILNYGKYIDESVLDQFEKETGIKVKLEEYESPEEMYTKFSAGSINYDLVCTSDYMVERLINEDQVLEINFDDFEYYKNLDSSIIEASQIFDPENKYSIPYCFGTVGILYNKTMVDDPVDSWSILWDEKYADNILMQDSVRDAFMVALKLKGYSMNTLDEGELNEAKQILIDQKPLVQAYVIDQVRDKMIGNEAAIGVIYSGEAIFTQRENADLEYVIPKEGTNVWIDSWVIPKNAPNKENAEKFIDFMCREDVALKNFEYITYSTPNDAARALIEDEDIKNSKIAFPDLSQYNNLETFHYLGADGDALYNELWKEVKAE